MSEVYKSVSFTVQGEFITNIARQWFYLEGRGYDKCIDLLENSMCGTDQTEAEIRRLAEDILLGRAALVGNTGDGSYHLEIYDHDECPKIDEDFNIWNKLEKLQKKLKSTQASLDDMLDKYNTLIDELPEWKQNRIIGQSSYGSNIGSSMLDSFIKRQMCDTEDDYGWLEPNGTFHPVEWGEHQTWAQKWIEDNFNESEYADAWSSGEYGDWLTERGWILLHSPSNGIAFPTMSASHRYTKQQQEFLFDYYMDRDCEKEANSIYST